MCPLSRCSDTKSQYCKQGCPHCPQNSHFLYIFKPFIFLNMPKFQKCAKALRCKLARFYKSPARMLQHKISKTDCIHYNRTNLDFIPGLTSTVLSELATTLTKTSPASGWFWRRRNLFTLSSKWFPKRVVCSPGRKGRTQPWKHEHGAVTAQVSLLLCSRALAASSPGWKQIFFSLLFYLHMKMGWFYLYSQREEKQTHPCYSLKKTWFPQPMEAELTEWHSHPVSELTKAALRSIFQFQADFMNPANVFSSQAHSGWLTEITSLHRSGSMPHLFKRSKANQQKWKAFWLQWRFHCFCFSFQESFWTVVAAICTSRLNSSCPVMGVLGSSSPQIVQMPLLHLCIHNWLLWGELGLWSYRMWWFSNKSTTNYRNRDDFGLN